MNTESGCRTTSPTIFRSAAFAVTPVTNPDPFPNVTPERTVTGFPPGISQIDPAGIVNEVYVPEGTDSGAIKVPEQVKLVGGGGGGGVFAARVEDPKRTTDAAKATVVINRVEILMGSPPFAWTAHNIVRAPNRCKRPDRLRAFVSGNA
jgi:hypothetical protein